MARNSTLYTCTLNDLYLYSQDFVRYMFFVLLSILIVFLTVYK